MVFFDYHLLKVLYDCYLSCAIFFSRCRFRHLCNSQRCFSEQWLSWAELNCLDSMWVARPIWYVLIANPQIGNICLFSKFK